METNSSTVSGLEPLLSIEELAEYLDVPVATIYDWRVDGKGKDTSVHLSTSRRGFGCAAGRRLDRVRGRTSAIPTTPRTRTRSNRLPASTARAEGEPGSRHREDAQAAFADDGAHPGTGGGDPAAVRGWRRGPGVPGPPQDGQLEQIIEVMLGTSARIGEVLEIRKCDVDVTVSPAPVRICGTIVSPAGKPTYRQHQPKTQKSTRVVSVPSFPAEALRQRLVVVAQEPNDDLLLFTRISSNRRHGAQQSKRPEPRCGDAGPHLVEDHQAALHRAGRDGGPHHRRDLGVSGSPRERGPAMSGKGAGLAGRGISIFISLPPIKS